jgi:GntR family transcriptional regulator
MLGQPGEFESAATLDEQSPTPLYLQLQRLVQELIRAGKLEVDEALPSERDLARQLGISRVTVRKALAGLSRRRPWQRWGSGTHRTMHVEEMLSRLSEAPTTWRAA